MSLWRALPKAFLLVTTLVLGGVSALAGVIGQMGRFNLTLDVLNHFAPIWLACGLGGAVLSFAFSGASRRVLLTLAAIGVVGAGAAMLPEFVRPATPHAAADAPGQIKVVQFNAWMGRNDRTAVMRWLYAENPDIILLEESRYALRRLIADDGRWHIACWSCTIVVASRAPISLSEVAPISRHPTEPITAAVVHLTDGDVPVVAIHNAWPTQPALQQWQERRLALAIARLGSDRTIVGGDFNSAPWSFSRRRWDKAFGLLRRDRALPSWPARLPALRRKVVAAPFPVLPIDHIYAGRRWATVQVSRGPRLGSDHYPLVVTLAPVSPR